MTTTASLGFVFRAPLQWPTACFLLCVIGSNQFHLRVLNIDKKLGWTLRYFTWTSVAPAFFQQLHNSTWCCPTYSRIIMTTGVASRHQVRQRASSPLLVILVSVESSVGCIGLIKPISFGRPDSSNPMAALGWRKFGTPTTISASCLNSRANWAPATFTGCMVIDPRMYRSGRASRYTQWANSHESVMNYRKKWYPLSSMITTSPDLSNPLCSTTSRAQVWNHDSSVVIFPIERTETIWIQRPQSAYLPAWEGKAVHHRIQRLLSRHHEGCLWLKRIKWAKISESEVELKIAPLFPTPFEELGIGQIPVVGPVKLRLSWLKEAGCYPPEAVT